MAIITKTITSTLFAAVALTASAAPARIMAPEQPECARVPMKVIPEHPEDETWKPIGEGIMRDDVYTKLYNVENYEFPVIMEESEQQPGRYRILNGWSQYPLLSSIVYDGTKYPENYKCYIVIDASNPDEVFMEQGFMGAYTSELTPGVWQEGVMWSQLGDYFVKNSNGFTPDDVPNIAGKLRNGAITFPKNALLFQEWNDSMIDEEGNVLVKTIWTVVNNNGKFRILLPGAPRVDMNIDFKGQSADGKNVEYTIDMQQDVAYARLALCAGDDVPTYVAGIIDGSIPSIKVTEAGTYSFPYENDGVFTLVAVPYTADDTPCYESSLTREYQFYNPDWEKVGKAHYCEGILSDNDMREVGFIFDYDEYDLDVEKSLVEPGVFRLVNPYGEAYYYTNKNNYDFSRNYYMEIEVRNPERVVVRKTGDFIGLDVGFKSMAIWSRADRYMDEFGMTEEEAIEYALELAQDPKLSRYTEIFGTLKDDVITFPPASLLLNFAFVRPDTWYWANYNGKAKIVLPKGLGQELVEAGVEYVSVPDGPAEYYTIDGVKVSSDNLKPGIYVVRQGGKAWKQVVK